MANMIHREFRRLWEKTKQEHYNEEMKTLGSTLAAIKWQERLDEFHEFVDHNAKEIADILEDEAKH
jgi:hypothetical protein